MFIVPRSTVFLRRLGLTRNAYVALRRLSRKEQNVVYSDFGDVSIPPTSLHQHVYEKFQPFHQFTAVECSVTGRKYTYEEVRLKARNLSKSLVRSLKLREGDVVTILLPNVPEWLICFLGVVEAGLTVTSMNPIYTPEEIAKQLSNSEAKAIITLNQTELHSTVNSAMSIIKKRLPVMVVKDKENEDLCQGCVDLREFLNSKHDTPDFDYSDADSLAFLPYSSGTTGLPKGVELTHSNLVSNMCQLAHPELNSLIPANGDFQETTPAVLPLFHIYGFMVTFLNCCPYGAKVVTLPKFHPDLYVSVLKQHKVTVIYAAPPLVLFLTQHPDIKIEYMQSVRKLMSACAPLGSLDERQFLEKFGDKIKVTQAYGLTETSPILTWYPKKIENPETISGSIGKLLPNTQAKIVDVKDGKPLGPHEQGELLIKGPQVMKGYHNRPEETQEMFSDGWLRTGDIAHYNDDRFFFVTDRMKELIKVKGFQVAPAELEELIRAFPEVEDAAVIGIPHPKHGEAPRAYVVPKSDASLIPEDLDRFVADKVANYKRLAGGIEVVDSIPKNASGKILRRQLKEMYQRKFE